MIIFAIIIVFIVLQDNLVLSHWRRTTEEGKDYPYAKFNKTIEVPTYTHEEYIVSSCC